MAATGKKIIERTFHRGKDLDMPLTETIRQAMSAHKDAGYSAPFFRDGKGFRLTPGEFPVESKTQYSLHG